MKKTGNKAKIQYLLSINNCHKIGNLNFSYGQTKRVSLSVNLSGASISVKSTHNYLENFEHSYLKNLFAEGIKRIALVYILKYQKPIQIKQIKLIVSKNGIETAAIPLTDFYEFYQMFDSHLLRSISPEWKNPDVLQNILKFRKTGNELSRNISALYAYLFSKTRNKETERFSYLWIAMNGFIVCVTERGNERERINAFGMKFGLGKSELSKDTRLKICKSGALEIYKLREPVTRENLADPDRGNYRNFIALISQENGETKFSLTPYGFLLTDFPYYLRCTLFHAERPMELFNFKNDWELKSLRITNTLLEDFLDRNLPALFKPDEGESK